MPEILRTKVINWYHDDPLARYFEINKTQELVARKYYWKTIWQDVESYIKRYDVYLASKAVKYQSSGDF